MAGKAWQPSHEPPRPHFTIRLSRERGGPKYKTLMLDIYSSTCWKTCIDTLQIASQDLGSLRHHGLRQLLLICLLCSVTRNCIQHYIFSILNVWCFIVPVTFVKHTIIIIKSVQLSYQSSKGAALLCDNQKWWCHSMKFHFLQVPFWKDLIQMHWNPML